MRSRSCPRSTVAALPLTATTSVPPLVEKPGGSRRAAGSSSSISGDTDAAPAAGCTRNAAKPRSPRSASPGVAAPPPIRDGRRENVRRSPVEPAGAAADGSAPGGVFGACAASGGVAAGSREASVRRTASVAVHVGPSSLSATASRVSANPASCAVTVYSPGATRTRYAPVSSVEVAPATMPSRVSTIDTPGSGVAVLVAVPVIRHGAAAGRV